VSSSPTTQVPSSMVGPQDSSGVAPCPLLAAGTPRRCSPPPPALLGAPPPAARRLLALRPAAAPVRQGPGEGSRRRPEANSHSAKRRKARVHGGYTLYHGGGIKLYTAGPALQAHTEWQCGLRLVFLYPPLLPSHRPGRRRVQASGTSASPACTWSPGGSVLSGRAPVRRD
jgi:hypothetical protein